MAGGSAPGTRETPCLLPRINKYMHPLSLDRLSPLTAAGRGGWQVPGGLTFLEFIV